jgi:hypothetical protein
MKLSVRVFPLAVRRQLNILQDLETMIQRPNLVASPGMPRTIIKPGEGLWGANSETGPCAGF